MAPLQLRLGGPRPSLRAPAAVLALLCALASCSSAGTAGQQGANEQGAARQGEAGRVVAVATPAATSVYTGIELDRPYAKPAGTFTDTAGRPFELATGTTKPVTLVFFGYTHCPDVCNTVLADAAMALRRAEPAVRDSTQLVFITTDPRRDTPAVLREYLDRFDPSYVGLTAPLPMIERAAAQLGVALTGTKQLAGGGYEVGHGTHLIGFGPDGKGRLVWMPDRLTVGGLREDLAKLVKT